MATLKVATVTRDRPAALARARDLTMGALLSTIAERLAADQEWADMKPTTRGCTGRIPWRGRSTCASLHECGAASAPTGTPQLSTSGRSSTSERLPTASYSRFPLIRRLPTSRLAHHRALWCRPTGSTSCPDCGSVCVGDCVRATPNRFESPRQLSGCVSVNKHLLLLLNRIRPRRWQSRWSHEWRGNHRT